MNLFIPVLATTPAPVPRSSVSAIESPYSKPVSDRPCVTADPVALARGRQERQARIADWAALDLNAETRLRQTFADEDHMRARLRRAGLRIASDKEPATVSRLRSLLRKAGLKGPQILDAVGTSLEGFLKLNPRLPLWAATALVLEASTAGEAATGDVA